MEVLAANFFRHPVPFRDDVGSTDEGESLHGVGVHISFSLLDTVCAIISSICADTRSIPAPCGAAILSLSCGPGKALTVSAYDLTRHSRSQCISF